MLIMRCYITYDLEAQKIGMCFLVVLTNVNESQGRHLLKFS